MQLADCAHLSICPEPVVGVVVLSLSLSLSLSLANSSKGKPARYEYARGLGSGCYGKKELQFLVYLLLLLRGKGK